MGPCLFPSGEISLYVYKFLLPILSFFMISSKQYVFFSFEPPCWLSLPPRASVKAFCQELSPCTQILLCSPFFFFCVSRFLGNFPSGLITSGLLAALLYVVITVLLGVFEAP